MYQLDTPDPTESALQETLEGISRAKTTNSMVELSPQNAYVRRLQHQLVERHELTARSTGKEPNRRLPIFTPADRTRYIALKTMDSPGQPVRFFITFDEPQGVRKSNQIHALT